ncbi:hypothetical protein ACFXKC_18005 [Streptomyces sp. NPDC059340]|uniref:hypothetical protein n=1 Tax=Streptomyces sp. NPDC059340 TaxID=3346806 RepID=UPI0036B6D4D8
MPVPADWTRRTELCDWLAVHDIDPHTVPIEGDLTIVDTEQGRAIRVEVYVRNEAGALVIDARGDREAREIRTVPLEVEPPVWWTPYEKPTREQLLTAADRVRALHRRNESTGECEYCSARDYPDYAVPHPCPTIRALDGQEHP